MNHEKKSLEVGDVIYDSDRWYGLNRYVIERVTEKQAVYNDGRLRCKRELHTTRLNENLYADKIGSYGSVSLERQDLKDQYALQEKRRKAADLVYKLSKTKISEMKDDDLDKLIVAVEAVLK